MAEYPIYFLTRRPFVFEGIKSFLDYLLTEPSTFKLSSCLGKCDSKIFCGNCDIIKYVADTDIPPGPQCEIKENSILIIDDYSFLFQNDIPDLTENEFLNLLKRILNSKYLNAGDKINPKLVLLTEINNASYLKYVIDLGIRSIIHITSSKENILLAIEAALKGLIFIDPFINNLIYKWQILYKDHPLNKLTNRELEILVGVSNGLKNQQLAQKLFISVSTIESHKNNILEKLDMPSAGLTEFVNKNKYEIKRLFSSTKK